MVVATTGPVLLRRDSTPCTRQDTRVPLDSASHKSSEIALRQGFPHLTVTGSKSRTGSVDGLDMPSPAQMTRDRAAQLGTQIHARRPSSEPSTHVVAQRPLNDGIALIPTVASAELNPEDYLKDGMSHAQLTFHTQVSGGNTHAFRTVELNKKNDQGNQVPDTERQSKIDKQFIQIKHLLGLGNRPHYGLTKLPTNYSVTSHYVEVFDENGEGRLFYLNEPKSIEDLLKWRKMDCSPENIDKISEQLLEIQTELQSLTKNEAGEYNSAFVQDCLGNLNGPAPFTIPSQALYHTANDPRLYLHTPTMAKRGLITYQGRFGRADKNMLTPKGKKAITQMRETRILQKIVVARYDMEISAKIAQLKQLQQALASSPDSYQLSNTEIPKLQKEIGDLQQVQAELAQASTMAIDFLLMTLNGSMPSDGSSPSVTPLTGKNLLHMEIDREAVGIPLPVYGDAVATERSDRLTDTKRHDYIDFMADQVKQDFSRTIVESNKPLWPLKYPQKWSKPHELKPDEREFAVMLGNHLYELERDKPSLDPIQLRKLQHLQKNGVKKNPQTDRAVDFLLYAGIYSDSAEIRGYKDHPLMQECLDLYLEKRAGLQSLYSPTKDFDVAVRSLKGLDSRTTGAIRAEVNKRFGPPETPSSSSPSVTSSEPLSSHNSSIMHI